MTESYPLPSHAAYIWFSGDAIFLAFPPGADGSRTHSVPIPIDKLGIRCNEWGSPFPDQRGWSVILESLKARAREVRSTIGQKGALPRRTLQAATESDAKYKEWLKAMDGRKAVEASEKAAAEEFLKELGL